MLSRKILEGGFWPDNLINPLATLEILQSNSYSSIESLLSKSKSLKIKISFFSYGSQENNAKQAKASKTSHN